MMKQNRDNFQIFTFLKERMHATSDYLVSEMENKLLQRRLGIDAVKMHKDPRIESLNNAYLQPFYLPSQGQTGQGPFDLETELKRIQN